MKKITILLALLFVSVALYAEKITLQTGDFFGISNTDYFYPKDITFTGSRLTITSVKKEEDNLWCLKLAAPKSTNTNAPIIFEYYVKKGDILTMRRLANPMEEITIKVVSVNWNEIMLVPGDFDHSVTGEKSQKVTREKDQKSHLTPLIIRFPEDCQKQFLPFL